LASGSDSKRDKAPGTKDVPEDGSSRARPDMTRREAADYIAGMLDGLHSIAYAADLPFVAYLLAMAMEEAQAEKSRKE
jgi:hypothetical protein